jgi:hypothetical protein
MRNLKNLKVTELKAILTENKIEFKSNAKKKTLMELVKETSKVKEAPKVKKGKKLTEEQKIANAKKRALNPNIANVISSAIKKHEIETKKSFKAMLIRTKKSSELIDNLDLSSVENLAYINKCKALINRLTRPKNQSEFIEFEKINKRNKYGNFQINYIAFNVSRVVKAQIKDSNLTVIQAITVSKK